MPREPHRGRPHASHGRDRWRPTAGAGRSHVTSPPSEGPGERPPPRRATSLLLLAVRYGLPGAIVLAGAVLMSFGTTAALVGGGAFIGAGLSTALISWLYRVGVAGDAARDDEELARRYFERFGRWPDERGGRPGR